MKTTVYTPESPLRNPGRMILQIFSDLWSSRELVLILFQRDLKAMYRQSILGYFWILAPPFVTAVTWYFFQSQGILQEQDTGSVPYPVYVLIGTMLWQTFSDSILNPLGAFHSGAPVFMKLKVPPEAFVAAGVAKNLFSLAVRLVVILPIAFFLMKSWPPATALLFPCCLIALILVGTALGLFLVPLGGLFGDIARGVGLAMPFLMYTTPVVWAPGDKGPTLELLASWNPISPLIQCGRDWLTVGPSEHGLPLVIAALPCLLLLVLGLLLLRTAMPHLVVRMGM